MNHHIKPVSRLRNLTIAAGLGAALTLSACSGDDGPSRDDEGTVTETQEASAFEIEEGDCILEATATEVFDVDFVPCSEPHDFEAYHVYDLDHDEFPGSAALEDEIFDACFTAFEDFVGPNWESTELDLTWFEPTQGSWNEGDREVACFVVDLSDEPKTGSARDAGR